MGSISYRNADYPVRPEFDECHSRFWDRLASPGCWLTAAQKIDIARELRHAHDCELCQARKVAVSPYQVTGDHNTVSGELTDTMVEVVHRIVTDPARLTRKWFDGLMSAGLTPEVYVEILGTLVHTLVIDEFCRGLGMPLNDLPVPKPGEPTGYRPEKAISGRGAWVPVLPSVVEDGPEADLWKRGANIARAMSLVPDEVRTLLDTIACHYIPYESVMGEWTLCPNGGLNRIQMEVIAARVSSHNECFY